MEAVQSALESNAGRQVTQTQPNGQIGRTERVINSSVLQPNMGRTTKVYPNGQPLKRLDCTSAAVHNTTAISNRKRIRKLCKHPFGVVSIDHENATAAKKGFGDSWHGRKHWFATGPNDGVRRFGRSCMPVQSTIESNAGRQVTQTQRNGHV